MAVKIVVPELGESILEATVSQWMKQEGDSVSVGDALVELETDKVNVEVGAERGGILSKIERQEGEDVQVGEVLGIIEEVSEEEAGQPAQAPEKKKTTADEKPEAPEKVQPLGEKDGDRKRQNGEVVSVDEAKATPVAQRLAQELNIDLSQVQGTGPKGRVTKENIEQFVEQRQVETKAVEPETRTAPTAAPKAGIAKEMPPAPSAPGDRREERVRMSRRRRTIAQRLVEAQQTAAILSTFNEIDMHAVMDLRKRRNEGFQARHGIKLGITSFFVKAAIGALKSFPLLNAEVQGDEILIKHYYDIGIAVGADEGLVVPVLRNADQMSFAQIEQKIKDFANQAQEGKLSLEDLRGGTFSITNGGVFGSMLSTPILNPPQVGILGLHKIEPRPVAVDGEIIIRPMMYVALSYDHRIVDGREAVQFLVRVKELIEDPEALLLEG